MARRVFCATCQREQPVFGVRCIVCGTLAETAPVSQSAFALRVLRTHPWLILVPAWLLSLGLLAFKKEAWETQMSLSRSGSRAVEHTPALEFLALLALFSFLFLGAGWIGRHMGGRSKNSHQTRPGTAFEAGIAAVALRAVMTLLIYALPIAWLSG